MSYVLRSSLNRPGNEGSLVLPITPNQTFDFEALISDAVSCDVPTSIADDLGLVLEPESELSDLTELEDDPEDSLGAQQATTPEGPGGNEVQGRSVSRSLANRKRTQRYRDNTAARKLAANPTPQASQVAVQGTQPVLLPFDAANLDAAYGAHTGKPGTAETLGSQEEIEAEYDLPELLEAGFQHVAWLGKTPVPILDIHRRVCGCLAGRPNQDDYLRDAEAAFELILREGSGANLGATVAEPHKRGAFPAYNCGVTMGMGTSYPVALRNQGGMDTVLSRIVANKQVQRLATYQSSTFKKWAPRVYAKYEEAMGSMHRVRPTLPQNFPKSIFASAAFNFGGKVRCFKHRDHMNWPFGWCAITALGKFDPSRSARLVLWEWKLVVDFPAGSTVFIPSAVVTHSNTRLAPGDVRASFTQYTAGAIFRWVESGCMSEKQLKNRDRKKWKALQEQKDIAVSERVKMFSTLEEIVVLASES